MPGIGNARVSGSWKLTDNKNTTALVLKIDGVVTLSLLGLMKLVVAPVVESNAKNSSTKTSRT